MAISHLDKLQQLLDQAGSFLGDLCAAPSQGGADAQALLDASLGHAWSGYAALRQRCRDDSLQIACLALAKAGEQHLQPSRYTIFAP